IGKASRGGLHDNQLPIENAAERMVGDQWQISRRVEKGIDRGGEGAAAAVAEDDDQSQAALQMLDGVAQASQYIVAKAIAGDTDHEEVVGAFIENEFDRHSRVRAAQHGRKRTMPRLSFSGYQAEILRIDLDNAVGDAVILGPTFEECCERAVAFVQPMLCRVGIGRTRAKHTARPTVSIGDFDGFHDPVPTSLCTVRELWIWVEG
ncbi:MAG TPA: hypothetical protein VL614_02875, partial [Acetobacteraceae bacterium]|nr:hypothetical protein [Acetobacteraceae bacterium]